MKFYKNAFKLEKLQRDSRIKLPPPTDDEPQTPDLWILKMHIAKQFLETRELFL